MMFTHDGLLKNYLKTMPYGFTELDCLNINCNMVGWLHMFGCQFQLLNHNLKNEQL